MRVPCLDSTLGISEPTAEHLEVLKNLLNRVRELQTELEFGNVGFLGEGKTGVPGEKPSGANERTSNKLNPHMVSTPEFEPASHISGRGVPSPLRTYCTPHMNQFIYLAGNQYFQINSIFSLLIG